MKHTIQTTILALLLALLTSSAFAYDPYYNLGHNIGSGLSSLGSGDKKITEYVNSYYNLKKIKKICYHVIIPKESMRYVGNLNIHEVLANDIYEKYKDKSKTNMWFMDAKAMELVIEDLFEKEGRNYRSLDPQTQSDIFSEIVREQFDAILIVSVRACQYLPNKSSIAYLDMSLVDVKDPKNTIIIFSRSEYRVAEDAGIWRSNNPEGVIKRILSKYTDDLVEKIKS